MKHLLKSILSVAIVASTLAGCSKDINEEPIVPEGKEFTLTLIANDVLGEESKTVYDDVIKNIKWSVGDEATTFINAAKNDATAKITDNKAAFAVESSGLTAGTYTVQGVYPTSALVEGIETNDKTAILSYKLILPAIQEATINSFDPKADILIAQNMSVDITDAEITAGTKTVDNFRFGRVGAISRYDFTLDNAALSGDEKVSSVTIKVEGKEENKILAGRFYFGAENGSFIKSGTDINTPVDNLNDIFYYGDTNTITVKLKDTPTLGTLKVWVVTAPITIASGDQITFTIETDKHTITKTSTASRDITYKNTQLNVGKVNLNNDCTIADKDAPGVIPDGNYVIVAEKDNKYYAVSAEKGSTINYRLTLELSDYTTGAETYMTENAKIIWGITKNGSYYHITNDGMYLYTNPGTDNKNNYALFGTPSSMSDADLNITKNDDGTFKIESVSYTPRLLAMNHANGINPWRFTFYKPDTNTNTANKRIESLLLIPVVEDPTPKIIVTESALNIDATATQRSIAYSVKNIEGTISATPTADWLHIGDISATEVKFTPDANYTKDERTATVTLSYEGAKDVTVTVKQAGSTFEITPTEITIPAAKQEAEFTVLSKEFNWTATATKAETLGSNITFMVDESGTAGETSKKVTVMCDAPATSAEQTLGTITVQRTDGDPQVVEITVKKAAAGTKQELPAPTVEVSNISTAGFTATWKAVDNAKEYSWYLLKAEKSDEELDAIDPNQQLPEYVETHKLNIAETTIDATVTLTAGTTYYLYVKSVAAADNANYKDSAWAMTKVVVPAAETTVTVNLANGVHSESSNTWTEDKFTMVQTKENSANFGNFISEPRWYQNNNVTFTPASDIVITKIIVTASSSASNRNGDLKPNIGKVNKEGTVQTWTGEASEAIIFTLQAQNRPIKVEVTYKQK